MSRLAEILLPMFGLMLLGFAAVRGRLLDGAGVRGLVLFVFTFSIPSLLLTSMAGLDFPPEIDGSFLGAFYAASLAVYALGLVVGRGLFGRPLADQAIFGMSAAFSNLVMVGIPVVLTALGPEAALPMMIIVGFHSATFMPLTVLLIQGGRGGGGGAGKRAARAVVDAARNPIIGGIALGLLINLSGLGIPTPVGKILDLLAATAVPCALFAMGASLAGYPLMGDVRPALLLSGLKLVVHPALVWLIGGPLLGVDGAWLSVAVLMSAMPTAVNVYLFGARYDAASGVAARTVLLTTIGSVLTLSVVLTLLGV
jgi:malonate transporter